jgi:hypothetical protein
MTSVPFTFGEPMIAMSREEVVRDIAIALAVIRPPVQVGRGRRLPGETDEERRKVAALIVQHFEHRGLCWFRPPPTPAYSSF